MMIDAAMKGDVPWLIQSGVSRFTDTGKKNFNGESQASAQNSHPQAREKCDYLWGCIKYGSSTEEEKERREYDSGRKKSDHQFVKHDTNWIRWQ